MNTYTLSLQHPSVYFCSILTFSFTSCFYSYNGGLFNAWCYVLAFSCSHFAVSRFYWYILKSTWGRRSGAFDMAPNWNDLFEHHHLNDQRMVFKQLPRPLLTCHSVSKCKGINTLNKAPMSPTIGRAVYKKQKEKSLNTWSDKSSHLKKMHLIVETASIGGLNL